MSRHMLFVPFHYKDDAKLLGAQWDIVNKHWFVDDDCKYKDVLIDTYKISNFVKRVDGYHMKVGNQGSPTTPPHKIEEYVEKRAKYLQENNTIDGFIELLKENKFF